MTRDYQLITLVGEIDIARSVELRALVQAYEASQSADAVVDMTAVSFCGSEGIEFLTGLVDGARTKTGTVTVLNASDTVQRLIKICALDGSIQLVHQ